jgi:hypothetical protein
MLEFGEGSQVRYVPTQASNGEFYVEAVALDEDEQVAGGPFRFEEFTASLRAVAESVTESVVSGLSALKPEKVSLEFGCEVGMKTGKLTAILVEGTAKANLKVTVEWAPGKDAQP